MKRREVVVFAGVILLTTFLPLTACTSSPSLGQVGEEPRIHTITVSGSGEVSERPDVTIVAFGVQTEAEEANVALSRNSEKTQALIRVLKQAEVSDEDIQTRTIQLWPRYEEPRREGQRELVGYTASNTVEVRVRDLGILGQLLDDAVQAGGNRIEGMRFEISDPAQSLDQARKAAWNDAKRKAEQMANLAGLKLGEVIAISETSRTPGALVRERIEGAAVTAPVEPGTQTVQASIEVTWRLGR